MQTFHLDLQYKGIVPLLYAKQRDVGEKIRIVLTDGGEEYEPDGMHFSVWFSGKSGSGNYTEIDGESAFHIEGNVVTVELIYQMLNKPGEHVMCLVMNDNNKSQKGLWNIPYFVEAIPGSDSEAATAYYNAFLESQKKAEEAAERAEAAADRAESAGGGAGNAVLYTPQTLTEKQKVQSKENIGASTFYHTKRDKVGKAHTDTDWTEYIYNQYRALPGVVEKSYKSNDGTFTNYEYVISTGEYSTDGNFANPDKGGSPDLDVKKPKYLILTGYHGIERHAAISVYRFIRDVLNGHNVPQSFKESVVIHVMPVGNPDSFNAFTYEDIGRFNEETASKETQAIINWMKANTDADLFIDLHNGSALNEVVSIVGEPDNDAVDTAKRIAMKGVDRIIPFWKDVIGYPSVVEVITDYEYDRTTNTYKNIELGYKPVIFSYSASWGSGNNSYGYATNALSIPSLGLEVMDYCGDYSDYNSTYDEEKKTATIPQTAETYPTDTPETIEAIAAGAEVIGNILLEFYEQSFMGKVVDDMKVIDNKLDSLLAQVNSGFRIVKGTEWAKDGNYITFPLSEQPKLVIWRATDYTQSRIVALAKSEADDTKRYAYGGIISFAKDLDTASYGHTAGRNSATFFFQYMSSNKVYPGAGDTPQKYENGKAYVVAPSLCTEVAKEDGTTTPAEYEWTAYYWNE